MKVTTDMVISNEEASEMPWNFVKLRKGDFALIAAHAKLLIVDGRGGEGFGFPMKSVTKRAFNVHLPKAMNLPGRIKGTTCNGDLKIGAMIK